MATLPTRDLADAITERDESPELRPGELPVVEGYEIAEEIGRGGMGVVYRARHLALDRVVALNTIHASDAEALTRFFREAKAVARLQHPNIIQIHEVTTSRGRPFLALEFVDGC